MSQSLPYSSTTHSKVCTLSSPKEYILQGHSINRDTLISISSIYIGRQHWLRLEGIRMALLIMRTSTQRNCCHTVQQ